MASISFSQQSTIFAKTHFTKSKSHSFPSLRNNFLAPKFDQYSLSEFNLQSQQKISKLSRLAALSPNQKPNSSPFYNLIHKFYAYLNSKDVKRLEKLFDQDCIIEDKSYYKPLQGKKIHNFFVKITEAMGQHVVFKIDELFEGDRSKVAVMWHLEWNGEIIPFTRGCSLYVCSQNNETVLIKKAHVFVEAPLKQGDVALDLLKVIIALFDRFPQFATSFLQKPDAIVYYFLKFYKFLLEPLLTPIIMYYSRLLTYGAKLLTTLLNILNNILKLFF